MAKRNKDCIMTSTHNKVMIRDSELGRVFNKTELAQWNSLIAKIQDFDLAEEVRKKI